MAPRGAADTKGSKAPRGGVIREATKRDLEEVVRLWSDLARHHAPLDPAFSLRPAAGEEIRALVTVQLRDPDAKTFVWECRDGSAKPRPGSGRLGALCMVRIDRAPPVQREVERAEITDLIVERALRRRGIGAAILDAALAWVEQSGVERVEVRVAVGNAEGQAFWRSRAFGDWMDVLHLRL